MRRLEDARGPKPFCSSKIEVNFPNTKLSFVGGTMSRLASVISTVEGIPNPLSVSSFLEGLFVVNQTGIPDTEIFDFVLEYGPEPNPSVAGPTAPPILESLGKLGLTLERSKAPREFIVIDHVERPSEN